MKHYVDFIEYLVAKGGPDAKDFYDLDAWIAEVADQERAGKLALTDLKLLRDAFGEAVSVETMQGFVLQKPHGYAGDYEIIDRIYTRYVSDKPQLSKWDVYAQEHACAYAVRNRVEYLCNLLEEKRNHFCGGGGIVVLNLASGPGRDMLKFFDDNPDAQVHFDCVELDQNAVNHAKALCGDFLGQITFHVDSVLRFQSKKKYDLIWSAGLFDYFDDKVFVHMLKKLGAMSIDGGEIVIGNFSTINPSKHYMELFEWHLHHRSPHKLKALALYAGFFANQISVKKEDSGVNLFLHIKPAGIRTDA